MLVLKTNKEELAFAKKLLECHGVKCEVANSMSVCFESIINPLVHSKLEDKNLEGGTYDEEVKAVSELITKELIRNREFWGLFKEIAAGIANNIIEEVYDNNEEITV